MSPVKFLSFALKVYVAIIVHLYKIDILKLQTEEISSLDSSISSFIVATCIACMFSKINLSQYFQSISNLMVYILELTMTLYGTELTMHMIWIPFLKALSLTCSKIGRTLMRSKYKFPANDRSNCVENDIFCYVNICLALFIASNTLASFDCMKNLKTLWPSKLITNKNYAANTESNDLTTEVVDASIPSTLTPDENVMEHTVPYAPTKKLLNYTLMADAVMVSRVRPKRKPIMLMNVR